MKLKNNIKSRAAYLGVKIKDLSEGIGVSHQHISNIANNKSTGIQFDILLSLCVILKCTPNDLFELVDE